MPGGLMQLTGFGAQNVFVNGNPSMSYFMKMYKRSTNFAMEHFRLDVRNVTDTTIPQAGLKTFRFKVPRYADLLHDCYVCVDLPDIWSPISMYNQFGEGIPYEFQWIRNIGYNLISEASVLFNGTPIVTMTGEWMKILSYLRKDATKREILDRMVGNTEDVYDPANANGRTNQYPNALMTGNGTTPAPSITGRQLTIPLPFWFCEEIAQSIPLVGLPQTEVEISVTINSLYNLFTIADVNPVSPTFGQRIIGTPGDNAAGVQNFLAYPDRQGNSTNRALLTWNLNPYIEANYIFTTDTERAFIASHERTFLITEVRYVRNEKQYGINNLEIPMYNLCTRVVALFRRNDRTLINDWDNYTNWDTLNSPPIDTTSETVPANTLYSSGALIANNMGQQDIFMEGNLMLDGKDRFSTKNKNFFRNIQNFKFSLGTTNNIPGIYTYSFSLDPDQITQPSGSLNGSMFNRTVFQYTLLTPLTLVTDASLSQPPICVVKSTVFNPNPTPVGGAATISPTPGVAPALQPGQTQLLYPVPTNRSIQFGAYTSMVYVESYNFLKVTNGIANLVFNT